MEDIYGNIIEKVNVICTSAIYENGTNFYEINPGTNARNPSCILVNNSAQKVKQYAEQNLKGNCSYSSNFQENETIKIGGIFGPNSNYTKNYKQKKIYKLLCARNNGGKCVAALADEINYEFDLNVITERTAEKYVKHNCTKINFENKETNVDKKRKGIDEQNTSLTNKKGKGLNNIAHDMNKVTNPRYLGHLIDQRKLKEASLSNNHPEINLMNSSVMAKAGKNQEINHETNIKVNDDFFDGLDEYFKETMGINIDNYVTHAKAHNIEESRDYDPHSIAESQSSSNSISNGSSNMTNMTSESDNESSTNVKSKNINKNIMETDEMLDDDLKFGWNDDEPQNL
uniref:Uncharacterized protein n=1 Tax=Meloidogyne floridensis TaxID=298350 RepID=A0A915NML1_9BILA